MSYLFDLAARPSAAGLSESPPSPRGDVTSLLERLEEQLDSMLTQPIQAAARPRRRIE